MKERLEYIDAARGLAIFTVVYCHICLFCLPEYDVSGILSFLRSYFLNAFFFISGLVAFRPDNYICNKFLALCRRKFLQLLLPAIVVGTVYSLSHNIPLLRFMTDSAKFGYWFTIVLFEMYIILYIILLIGRNVPLRFVHFILLGLLSLSFYIIHRTGICQGLISDTLCLGSLTYYMPFFCLGYIASGCKTLLNKVLMVGAGIPLTVAAIIVAISYILPLPSVITNFVIVVLVLWILKKVYGKGSAELIPLRLKKGLLVIGNYTLEIYFLHYFLLFPLPQSIGQYFEQLSLSHQSLSFPEFIVVGLIVALICASCILISNLLKTIPYLSLIAFGKSTSHAS